MSTNAAKVVARAQARAEDENIFSSIKRSREHLDVATHGYENSTKTMLSEQYNQPNPKFYIGGPPSAPPPVTSDGLGSKITDGPLDHIIGGFPSGAPSLRKQKEILAEAGLNSFRNDSSLSKNSKKKSTKNSGQYQIRQLNSEEIFSVPARNFSVPVQE